jgi:hypothetical protein
MSLGEAAYLSLTVAAAILFIATLAWVSHR